jgi:hypothetical protein
MDQADAKCHGCTNTVRLGAVLGIVAAGLPGPTMRMDALIGGGPGCPAYELVADVTRSLLPVMEKLKIATATEVDVSSLAQRLRNEVVAAKGVVRSPGLIGAWSRRLR